MFSKLLTSIKNLAQLPELVNELKKENEMLKERNLQLALIYEATNDMLTERLNRESIQFSGSARQELLKNLNKKGL